MNLKHAKFIMIDKTKSERFIYDTKGAGYGGLPRYHIFDCYAWIGGIKPKFIY